MHAIANKNIALGDLPSASSRQIEDRAHDIESILWNINLSAFGITFLILIYSVFTQSHVISILMLAIMVTTFTIGYIWSSMPNIHVSEFSDSIRHNEILLMVDVPYKRVNEVGEKINKHHPEVVAGGTSWMINAFDM